MFSEKTWFFLTCLCVFILNVVIKMYSLTGKMDANIFLYVIPYSFGATLVIIFASCILGMLAIGAILFIPKLSDSIL